ncbi:hypothetical protein HanRHA438_Chr01g0043921 [Helianthus annuus]|nr:hypothetical protein HanRHA438_Chr01g0043921 [Helianthus annuus]
MLFMFSIMFKAELINISKHQGYLRRRQRRVEITVFGCSGNSWRLPMKTS